MRWRILAIVRLIGTDIGKIPVKRYPGVRNRDKKEFSCPPRLAAFIKPALPADHDYCRLVVAAVAGGVQAPRANVILPQRTGNLRSEATLS